MKGFYFSVAVLLSLVVLASCANPEGDEPQVPVEPPPPPALTVPFPEAMFGQNGCASCHGPEGDGRGVRSEILSKSRMPNFKDRSTYLYGSSKEEIAKSIRNGVPGTYMKAYKHLRYAEIDALASYIVNFQKR